VAQLHAGRQKYSGNTNESVIQHRARDLLGSQRMSTPAPQTPPRYSIVPTERGWLLTIQNDHFSVMQVFRSAATARQAVDRMMEFF